MPAALIYCEARARLELAHGAPPWPAASEGIAAEVEQPQLQMFPMLLREDAREESPSRSVALGEGRLGTTQGRRRQAGRSGLVAAPGTSQDGR